MRRVGVVVVVAGVVALGAIAVVGVRSLRRPPVVLVGDSITNQTAPVFTEELGGDWKVTAHGENGHRADELVPAVPALAEVHPAQVVINLGTNDVMQRKDPAQTQAAIEQVAAGFGDVRCIHLVTVNERMVSLSDPGLLARTNDLNGRIRASAAAHGWGVVPWDELVATYDAGPQPEGPMTKDTVHPSDYGEHVLADAYARALDDGCPG